MMVRPLSSWTFLPYSPRAITSRRQAMYSSRVTPALHAHVEQVAENVVELGARLHQLLGQVVDALIGLVADDQPPLGVEHAEALARYC